MGSLIEELAEELARAEERVSRLLIAREEVTRVLEGPAPAEAPAGLRGEPQPAWPIGAVTVPPWQEVTEASVLAGDVGNLHASDERRARGLQCRSLAW